MRWFTISLNHQWMVLGTEKLRNAVSLSRALPLPITEPLTLQLPWSGFSDIKTQRSLCVEKPEGPFLCCLTTQNGMGTSVYLKQQEEVLCSQKLSDHF